MLNFPIYQVDAFTSRLFGGNPAAVVPLPEFFPDELLQQIATENNLSETAFVVVRGRGKFFIRWFTPTAEVRLCGHATLAAAHVMFHSGNGQFSEMKFKTTGAGTLTVRPGSRDGEYQMDFPADQPQKVKGGKADAELGLRNILGVKRLHGVYRGQDDLMVILRSQKQVEGLDVDFRALAKLTQYRGLLVSAPGKKVDFVSRCFFPQTGIDEDPVTGSAHTLLTPYWSSRLGKKTLIARQLSERGGDLKCQLRGKKIRLTGRAVTYLSGQIHLTDH
ncbi:PhzF family phenazine biosynthesis protein [Neolewinella antarctica]|uniref:PhzF family phenazine biosynthesis protein n=1 Tax=Neolewinella antarctica TaxID=442734 RepID=A0ABX0X7V5_9BACT|nr:PhzF family phenazine biosynthesis protein [Neolewinella antarctica]NJC25302.1 PhzF family phenazine biosynthesis protein [Neolewinella antarctica]